MASLLLVVVAFHPSVREVEALWSCLAERSKRCDLAVVINDHHPGEPADRLALQAQVVVRSPQNLGYGRAVNAAVAAYEHEYASPRWIAALNTDLTWAASLFEDMLAWLDRQPNVVLAVPQILSAAGEPERLCKRDPSLLSLASRRFIPAALKPRWLRRYDALHVMADCDQTQVLDVPYLSGCCMVIRRSAFAQVGGFDPRYFLYLEDADLTRSLRALGRCVHLPLVQVTHVWGRGNHRNLRLTLVNLISAWRYFCKWGWRLW